MKKNERLITNKQIEELIRIHDEIERCVAMAREGKHEQAIDQIEQANTALSIVYLSFVLM